MLIILIDNHDLEYDRNYVPCDDHGAITIIIVMVTFHRYYHRHR